jgi:hypothetical protein
MFDLNVRMNDSKLKEFAQYLQDIQSGIDFKISARGWCYQLEQARLIDKDQFSKVEDAVNKCRKKGYLPVDFVAEEDARAFSGISTPSSYTLHRVVEWTLDSVLDGSDRYYTPDWWEGEEYYIQVVVEKIDLKSLFEPVCRDFHIPIANAKGWQSVLQRAEYARRFKEAEDKGLKCVLLYCGDHDPDGARISDTLRKNLQDVSEIVWSDGTDGYDPSDLTIDRFGLNYDFILSNKLTWIDNLITGSGKDLNDPKHPNFHLPYLKNYKSQYGLRKCEANAIVVIPNEARELMRETIFNYIGEDAEERFEAKREAVREQYNEILDETGIRTAINNAKDMLE